MKSIKFPPLNQSSFSKSSSNNKEAYLLFPGFPGTQGKNEDIAEAIFKKTQLETFVIHYTGLTTNPGPDETFDFLKSVDESIQFVKSLLVQYEKLHLVGHSWGGLIALNIFSKVFTSEQRGKLILLAPFTEFPKDGSVENWLIPMATKQEHFRFSYKNPEDVRNNFFAVEKTYSPRDHLDQLKIQDEQITLIEAINDPDVSNYSTDSLYQILNRQGKIQRFHLQDDHCFIGDRLAIINTVLAAIEKSKTCS